MRITNSQKIGKAYKIIPMVRASDVARPVSCKTKTTYFLKTKTTFSRPRPLF